MDDQIDVIGLKETIHDIKLKDAIVRQDLMKTEREGQMLRDQILKMQKDIQKLEKDLKKDEKLLISQEENIVTATIAVNNRKKNRRNDCNLLQESIDRQQQVIKEMKRRQDDVQIFMANLRKRTAHLEIALKDTKNSNDAMVKMRDFMNFWEEHLGNLDILSRTEEILYQEELKFYNAQYSIYEKQLNELDSERVVEMKKLYDLENRSNLSESDKVIYSKNVDLKTEQVAISAAESILARLKEKLSDSNALGGVVNKIDMQISKHKKKVIHVDLS
ncbi:hypothetical protein SteCoe_1170 [Stentor coeruleus]|uniref:Uncharacterized protein n=1 Tax=Stentor coeruleus TaxID=5963 RepID=A0A1R2D2A9_9CILI|nr:hypothetical protein SteCoe_1170 [Stentor coeruleus]